jgi:RimJ/RimL family protein N-acetyltransferase
MTENDNNFSISIFRDNIEVGYVYIKRVNKKMAHIEYTIFEQFRGQKILKNAIPKLVYPILEEEKITRLMAQVKEENIASIKILEALNFIHLKTIRDVRIYCKSLILDKLLNENTSL